MDSSEAFSFLVGRGGGGGEGGREGGRKEGREGEEGEERREEGRRKREGGRGEKGEGKEKRGGGRGKEEKKGRGSNNNAKTHSKHFGDKVNTFTCQLYVPTFRHALLRT